MGFDGILLYTLVMTNIAIENGHIQWNCPLKMVIFHSCVRLPEGKWDKKRSMKGECPINDVIYHPTSKIGKLRP